MNKRPTRSNQELPANTHLAEKSTPQRMTNKQLDASFIQACQSFTKVGRFQRNERQSILSPEICLGMKFWSCCQKKTTDFDAFTAQPGCTQGEHLWRNEAASSSSNEDDPQVLRSACRYDYHPQGPSIVLTIYAKMARPDQTTVEMHAGRLKVDTRFGPDQQTKRFANDWNLFGLIDVERSTVELLQTKIEITMKKAEPVNWTRLDRPVT